jgi:hypothetical protein
METMEKQKLISLGAGVIAIILLVGAAFSSSWIIGRGDGIESKVGLRAVHVCSEGSDCAKVDFEEWSQSAYAPKGLSTFRTLGSISFYLSLATAAALAIAIAFAAMKRTPHLPMHPATLSLLLTIALLFVGVATLALHPFKSSGWGTGPGFVILAGGDVAALIASLYLGRSGPIDEDAWFE